MRRISSGHAFFVPRKPPLPFKKSDANVPQVFGKKGFLLSTQGIHPNDVEPQHFSIMGAVLQVRFPFPRAVIDDEMSRRVFTGLIDQRDRLCAAIYQKFALLEPTLQPFFAQENTLACRFARLLAHARILQDEAFATLVLNSLQLSDNVVHVQALRAVAHAEIQNLTQQPWEDQASSVPNKPPRSEVREEFRDAHAALQNIVPKKTRLEKAASSSTWFSITSTLEEAVQGVVNFIDEEAPVVGLVLLASFVYLVISYPFPSAILGAGLVGVHLRARMRGKKQKRPVPFQNVMLSPDHQYYLKDLITQIEDPLMHRVRSFLMVMDTLFGGVDGKVELQELLKNLNECENLLRQYEEKILDPKVTPATLPPYQFLQDAAQQFHYLRARYSKALEKYGGVVAAAEKIRGQA